MRKEYFDMHRLQEMVRLRRAGLGYREIARTLEMSPNTERKYRNALIAAGLYDGPPDELPTLSALRSAVEDCLARKAAPAQEVSSVEAYREQIETMLSRGAGPTSIFDCLRVDDEFTGSLSAVKRMCLSIQRGAEVRAEDVVIRVHTEPGEIAQVDFGFVGRLFDPVTGKIRKAYVFVMVLGFSRLMYVDVVFDQTIATWVDQHRRAFQYFGAVPRTVVPDNLKAAVIQCFFGFEKKPELNRSYRELARHYGFLVDPTPPRSPHLKGKVESAVKYVKQNFFRPRDLETIDEARNELSTWLEDIANVRVHGTTRRIPREVYDLEEYRSMKPLPPTPYTPVTWKLCKVHPDSHVEFERRLYSVPFNLVGELVWVRVKGDSVEVLANDERVANHARRGPRYSTQASHLPEGRRDLSQRSHAWWQERAHRISPIVGEYIDEVFQADDVASQLRTVQAMVTYLEKFPVERAEATCRRARVFGNYTYQGIRTILIEALDMEPVFPAAIYVHGKLDESPRFARDVHELLETKGVNRG